MKERINLYDENLFLSEESFQSIFQNKKVKIEKILSPHMPDGNLTWYNQPITEIVFLMQGFAKIEFENNSTIALKKGEYLVIKPSEKHRIAYTSEKPQCIWLAIHLIE